MFLIFQAKLHLFQSLSVVLQYFHEAETGGAVLNVRDHFGRGVYLFIEDAGRKIV